MKPDDLAEFLRQPHIGVLATLRRDGCPYTVPIWFLYDDDAFWITGTYDRLWCKQLLADPRASLCIEAAGPIAGHVGADGTVTVRELPAHDIWPVSKRLVDKYIAPEQRDAFFANMRTEHRLLFELRTDVLRAIDMRVYRGKRADREYQRRQAGNDVTRTGQAASPKADQGDRGIDPSTLAQTHLAASLRARSALSTACESTQVVRVAQDGAR